MPTRNPEVVPPEVTDPRPVEIVSPDRVEAADYDAQPQPSMTRAGTDWLGNSVIGNITSGISYAGEIPAPAEPRQVPSADFRNLPA